MRRLALLALGIGLIAIDRLTKIAFDDLALGGSFRIPGIISITQHQNHGIVANIPVPIPIIITLTLVALVAIAVALVRSIRQNAWPLAAGYTILAAGALSNLLDRLMWGFVNDWLLLGGRSIVNAADIFVATGLLIVLLKTPRVSRLDTKPETR